MSLAHGVLNEISIQLVFEYFRSLGFGNSSYLSHSNGAVT